MNFGIYLSATHLAHNRCRLNTLYTPMPAHKSPLNWRMQRPQFHLPFLERPGFLLARLTAEPVFAEGCSGSGLTSYVTGPAGAAARLAADGLPVCGGLLVNIWAGSGVAGVAAPRPSSGSPKVFRSALDFKTAGARKACSESNRSQQPARDRRGHKKQQSRRRKGRSRAVCPSEKKLEAIQYTNTACTQVQQARQVG